MGKAGEWQMGSEQKTILGNVNIESDTLLFASFATFCSIACTAGIAQPS
jgi:hypothetical protein